jgi:glutamate-1-semialdehyde 2,1-aminomutase
MFEAAGGGLAQLNELDKGNVYAQLEDLGVQLECTMREVLKKSGIPFTFYRYGSMFCLFFTGGPVRNLTEAMQSDREKFSRFFNGLLDRSVYIAPSQFETGFLSAAHTPEDIVATARAASDALASC